MSQILETDERAQVEQVLKSDSFSHAESLRRLLNYLVERTLDGTADQLKEYSIGVAVLGKPESYDPQTDASVRVQMGKLRQRLKEYYRTEGRNSRMIVDLPARQFIVHFEPREAPAQISTGQRYTLNTWMIVLATAVILLAVGFGWLAGRSSRLDSRLRPVAAELREFWGPVVDGSKPALICLGTPLFLRFKGGARLRYNDNLEDALNDETIKKLQEVLDTPVVNPVYDYTGIGEATAAFLLARFFGRLDHEAEIRRDSALGWDEIKNSNLIFLGSAKYNPHLKQLPFEQNFQVAVGGVKNLHPAPGEPANYDRRRTEDADKLVLEDYALIGRIPGLDGRNVVVWLGGSSTWSTWAAVECLVESHRFHAVMGRLRDAAGKLPPFFEMVVRVRFQSLVPVDAAYVTHRVITTGKADR